MLLDRSVEVLDVAEESIQESSSLEETKVEDGQLNNRK